MTLHFNSRFAALFALSNLTVLTRRQCTISQADGVSQVNVELFGNWNGCKSTTIASRKQPTIWSYSNGTCSHRGWLPMIYAPALTNFEWPDGFFWKWKHGVSTAIVLGSCPYKL